MADLTNSQTIPARTVPTHNGNFLLYAIVLIIVAVAALDLWQGQGMGGSASLLVRSIDGVRSVQSLSLETGTLTALPDVSVDGMNTRSLRTFTMSDDTVITVDLAGVVRKTPGDSERVTLLVASAVPTSPLTPLSVWGDAQRVAWVSPADNSIQVFEKNDRGVYLPIFVRSGIPVSSMQFTLDGTALVVAKIGLTETAVSMISFDSEEVREVTHVPGFATVIPQSL